LTADSGRFYGRDTFDASLETPLQQNPYLYSLADPENRTDPTGLFTLADVTTAAAIRNTLAKIEANAGWRIINAVKSGTAGAQVNLISAWDIVNLAFATIPIVGDIPDEVVPGFSSSVPGTVTRVGEVTADSVSVIEDKVKRILGGDEGLVAEFRAASAFMRLGATVRWISERLGSRTPDLEVKFPATSPISWEVYSPEASKTVWQIAQVLITKLEQSPNIVLDLSRNEKVYESDLPLIMEIVKSTTSRLLSNLLVLRGLDFTALLSK
jgi:hypothetical protein